MLKCLAESLPDGFKGGNRIKDGDLVIVYLRHEDMKAVTVDSGKQFSCKFGNFSQKEWVGKSFGSKVCSSKNKGFVYLLAPSPELWRAVLRHRTQILYTADVSIILFNLELMPGSVVLETGTGSGGLTHALIQAVAPRGHVHTFEFHKERCQEAANEFAANGVEDFVSLELRNTETDGFPSELHDRADAVFLDLPGPYKVVPSAARCLKGNGKFCSFSPCIEQDIWFEVEHDCASGRKRKLEEREGEIRINNKQNRKSGREVSTQQLQQARGHTGYLTFAKNFKLDDL